ncbi:hypothetical protein ILYODFUR_007090 [Ilyodon furcidens]|uniref:Uncharacterized protein n=1 Tax=Ilyodon furcidens TaxID=33524 RepID=A0ABV0T711_9TELE
MELRHGGFKVIKIVSFRPCLGGVTGARKRHSIIFAPKVKKCNNFSKEIPNHTKVGMKEDLQVPDYPMGSYADIIKATPPGNRKSLFLLGKVAICLSTFNQLETVSGD